MDCHFVSGNMVVMMNREVLSLFPLLTLLLRVLLLGEYEVNLFLLPSHLFPQIDTLFDG